MDFLKQHYGTALGPLGFPVTDKQAFALEAIIKALPKEDTFKYRHMVIEKGNSELMPGERSDVSWISTEDPDRTNEVVLAKGMNDAQFRQNPLVTFQHMYWYPPAGKSLWRKFVRDGETRGIKAKTQYPQRPKDFPNKEDWIPDIAFGLVQAQMMNGKSIGFIPTRVHMPDRKEIAIPGWEKVELIIDEWLLLEYACCFLPCQQNAVVEDVSKTIQMSSELQKALGIQFKAVQPTNPDDLEIPFRTVKSISKAFEGILDGIDPVKIAEEITQNRIDRIKGKI